MGASLLAVAKPIYYIYDNVMIIIHQSLSRPLLDQIMVRSICHSNFWVWTKSYGVTIQIKPLWQYFHMTFVYLAMFLVCSNVTPALWLIFPDLLWWKQTNKTTKTTTETTDNIFKQPSLLNLYLSGKQEVRKLPQIWQSRSEQTWVSIMNHNVVQNVENEGILGSFIIRSF